MKTIKPIVIDEEPNSTNIYFIDSMQIKESQLFLAKVNEKKIKTLAVYEKTSQRFEDVTILFTEEYLQSLHNTFLDNCLANNHMYSTLTRKINS